MCVPVCGGDLVFSVRICQRRRYWGGGFHCKSRGPPFAHPPTPSPPRDHTKHVPMPLPPQRAKQHFNGDGCHCSMVMGSGCVFRCVWLCGGCVMVGSGVPSKLAQGFLQQCQLSWHCCRKPLYCRGQVVMEKHQVLTAQPPPAPSQTQRNHNPTCLTPSPLNNGNQKQKIGAMALRGEAPEPPPRCHVPLHPQKPAAAFFAQ